MSAESCLAAGAIADAKSPDLEPRTFLLDACTSRHNKHKCHKSLLDSENTESGSVASSATPKLQC